MRRALFFFTPFCRDKVSRSCFTGQLPGIGTVFILASLQIWWELCEEVTEGRGIAIEIMMVGWIFEKEAGCKCRECCVGEETCPSGDEGRGSGMAFCCGPVGACLYATPQPSNPQTEDSFFGLSIAMS